MKSVTPTPLGQAECLAFQHETNVLCAANRFEASRDETLPHPRVREELSQQAQLGQIGGETRERAGDVPRGCMEYVHHAWDDDSHLKEEWPVVNATRRRPRWRCWWRWRGRWKLTFFEVTKYARGAVGDLMQ